MAGLLDALTAPNRALRRFGRHVDSLLQGSFGVVGRWVALRPYKVMLACIIFTAICSLGIIRINVVTDGEKLYTPQSNQAFDDRDYVEALYAYPTRQTIIYATASSRDGSNILTKPALLAYLDLFESLRTLSSTTNGQTYKLESSVVCYRYNGPNSPCDKVSVLDYWQYNRTLILADPDIGATVSNAFARDGLGRTISPTEVMGRIVRGPGGKVVSVEAYQMKLTNQNNKPSSKSSSKDEIIDNWEDAANNYVLNKYTSSELWTTIADEFGQNQEEDSAITSDVSLLIIGYILLAFYGQLVLAKKHPVYSSSWLGLMSIISVAFSVVCSYGICMVAGVDYNLVVQVLALLLLGLGTDDMLVTMAAHEETGKEMSATSSVIDRVQLTVARARRGVIVATTTNLVAFATGISSELPALRDFMIYAAVGILFVLAFQSTWFVACLTLDLRRQQAGRVDWLCCIRSKKGPSEGCFGEFDPSAPSISQRLIGIWLPKVILHPLGKVVVLALTIGLVIFAAVGASKVKQNFNNEWFIPSGSYYDDVLDVRNQYFQGQVAPFAIYTKNPTQPPLDYFNYQDELARLVTDLQGNEYIAKVPTIRSWYSGYIAWLGNSTYANQLNAQGRPQSSSDFYKWLGQYLDSAGQQFKQDVVFFDNVTRTSIRSSRIQAFFKYADNSQTQVDEMRASRDLALAAAPSLQPVSYSAFFVFWEGFAVIKSASIKEVLIAGSVVFVIMLVLLADITTAILVGIMVAFVDIELVGFLYWSNLDFNSVTSINLLLAIGIAVDYSAFTAYAFLSAQEGNRTERAHAALRSLGVAVFNGGFTMFLAILPAVGAKSYIFQTFFKMFCGIVILGLWHGLIALPVVLSLIGSSPYDRDHITFLPKEVNGKEVDKMSLSKSSTNGKAVEMSAPGVPTMVNGTSGE